MGDRAQDELPADAGGEVEIIAGTTRDVTERKDAEEALRASEERFRALITATSDVVYRMSPDWTEMRHLRGRNFIPDTDEPSFDWLERYIHPDDQPGVMAVIQEAIRTKSVFELEHRVLRVDGSLGWTFSRAIPLLDENGEIVEWFGAASDVTHRKEAEQALRESEEQFRTLANAIPQLCWMAHADGWIFWYNERWYQYTGTTAEEAQGWGWQSVHDARLLPAVVERWKHSIATGKPLDITFQLRGADGVFRPFLTRVMPVFDRDGKVVRWFGTNTDISEQRRAEGRVRQLNAELEIRVRERTAQLEAANRELESFAYSVSHDLRAPLRGIDGWSMALVEDYGGQLDERAQKYLSRVRAEAQRMGVLIDDLLQLSRVSRSPIESGLVDLSATANTVAGRLREAHPERRMEIAIRPGLKCLGDERLLEAALTNLFGNAVKFTASREVAEIDFGLDDQDQRPFYIRDNGVGFDMAYAGMLFGAFQRLHRGSEFPGTGIGLATVQRIIHRHGGRVWAQSEPGRGATFYFTVGMR